MIWRSAGMWEGIIGSVLLRPSHRAHRRGQRAEPRRHMRGAVQTVSGICRPAVCSAPGRGVRRAFEVERAAARTFLMIMTRKGSLMPKVLFASAGHETKVRRDVGRHDLEHAGLDVIVGDALDVAVLDDLLPDLERLPSLRSERQVMYASESSRLQAGAEAVLSS